MILIRLFVCACLSFAAFGADAAKASLNDILAEVAKRSADPALAAARDSFAYQRTSRVDYLNDDGTLRKQTVRLYQVYPENGVAVPHLISINGHPKESHDKKGDENGKGDDDKHRSPTREAGDRSRFLHLTSDLLAHFDFTLKGEEKFNGRMSWVLGFVPKPDAPSDGLIDKVINAVGGTLWIDEEDYQMAKADVHLSRKVSFFAGIAGAIDVMNLQVIQKRLAPAVWLHEGIVMDLTARKFLSPVRLRCFENCSGFHKVPEQEAQASAAK